jgi:hypothetical protein
MNDELTKKNDIIFMQQKVAVDLDNHHPPHKIFNLSA